MMHMQQAPNWTRRTSVPGSCKPISKDRKVVADSSQVLSGQNSSMPNSTAESASRCNVARSLKTVATHDDQNPPGFDKRVDANFANFEASVSDAWSVDDCLINPKAAQVSAETVLKHHSLLLGSSTHSRHARAQALQRLATQKEPLPITQHLASNNVQQQTGSSIYPKLADFPHETTVSRGNIVDVLTTEEAKYVRIEKLLNSQNIDLVSFRGRRGGGYLNYKGLIFNETHLRGKFRKTEKSELKVGYLPPNKTHMDRVLKKKREDYFDFVQQYFHTRHDENHQDTFRQIHIDIPRMCPLMPLFQQKVVQEMFERILYIWAIRHPASGYVQGINDLVTPFFVVFLSEFVDSNKEVGSIDLASLPRSQREAVEADSFWCVTLLLDTIQENYTFAQPGIQLKVRYLQQLVSRVDNRLHKHLMSHQVEYLQFAFRWMNNLLMREIPLRASIRLWDTYLSEVNGFADFHVYVCGAFLRMWSKQICLEKDFQSVMILLQNLPTQAWSDQQIAELTADAYSLMQLFADAKNHLDYKSK